MIDHNQASDLIRTEVARIVTEGGLVNPDQGETVQRAAIRALQWAWCQAVRAEWQAFVDADPELKAQHAVALELMREDGYGEDRMPDAICMMPGIKPLIAKVENQEAVCVDYCMTQVTPLSALYTNRVRLVQSAAARVAKTLAEKAAKEPPSWPITIANGETFNSIKEMEASPINAVREMAKMMRDADATARGNAPLPGLIKPQVVTAGLAPSPTPTCWQYFGFDGPTDFTSLHNKYLGTISSVTPMGIEDRLTQPDTKLAAEVHRQYQNCLKDLANMTAGPAVTIGDDDVD